MEVALLIVVAAVTVACAVIALFTLAGSAKTYAQIGAGGTQPPQRDRDGPAAAVGDERDEEIRQLVETRNVRRARRGQAPLPVDAELAAPAVDEALHDEVRQLVLASNSRRRRNGQAPLDVEREIVRRLRELT